MKRITEILFGDYVAKYDSENPIHKLGQIEDIEDNLGTEIITLFKAIENPENMGVVHFE